MVKISKREVAEAALWSAAGLLAVAALAAGAVVARKAWRKRR
jgi:hypothetical protein